MTTTFTATGLVEEASHKAIIYGSNAKAIYKVIDHSYSEPKVEQRWEIVDDRVEIFNGVLDRPLIEKGESVFLETKEVVKITSRVRNVDGGYVYLTDHIVMKAYDETSEASKLEAEAKLIKLVAENKSEVAVRAFKNICDTYNKLPWYKKMFTNKPY